MAEIKTYILILHLAQDTTIRLGTLGDYTLPNGYYAYVDEAPANKLPQRLKQHLSPIKFPKIHIDYLQEATMLEEIWFSDSVESRRDDWADLLAAIPGGIVSVEGFGDEEEEETYLIYFEVRPQLEDFAVGAAKLFPNEVILRAFSRPEPENDSV